MSNKLKGVVEQYYVDGPRSGPKGQYYIHSVTVGGEKYGAFGSKDAPLANSGDTVEFDWYQNGKYRNFEGKSFKVLERGQGPVRKSSTNDSIARQNACRHATAMVLAFKETYSRPDQMATDVVNICKDIIFPYINDGTICGEAYPVEHSSTEDDGPPF